MDKDAERIREIIQTAPNKHAGKKVLIVCNTKTSLPHFFRNCIPYDKATEFLSDAELDEVISMFYSAGFTYEIFTDEIDFIRYIINKQIDSQSIIVYNSAQSGSGAGRKSLIPALCNLLSLPITGSDPYVVGLCRNKYHVNKLLRSLGLSVPSSWLYSIDWVNDRPPNGQKIILKPNYESSSIGIDLNSVFTVNGIDKTEKEIAKRENALSQPILVQEFISGYEVEVPIVSVNGEVLSFPPVGLTLHDDTQQMGDSILDYEHIYADNYSFFDFEKTCLNIDEIKTSAKIAAKSLGINGLGRIDFRITPSGEFFITDVSTNPHFITHSSVHYALDLLGFVNHSIINIIVNSSLAL
jgi:D-alanine-D-alanine ligase